MSGWVSASISEELSLLKAGHPIAYPGILFSKSEEEKLSDGEERFSGKEAGQVRSGRARR